MRNSLNWKKPLFSDAYRIYSGNRQIGLLKEKLFSQTATGEVGGSSYSFNTRGFFGQKTEIIDNSNNHILGEITYSNWMTRARIMIGNREYTWKYENAWQTKWSLHDPDGNMIRYSGWSTHGEIDSGMEDPLLLLTGLFVMNYYGMMTLLVLLVILIPILA